MWPFACPSADKFEVSPADKDDMLSVTPRVAALHEQLYDSPLDSMLWQLSSADGGGGGGAILGYGGAIHNAAPFKLRRGSYTVSLLLRHPAPSQVRAAAARRSARSTRSILLTCSTHLPARALPQAQRLHHRTHGGAH
jgi:hypothetical protein